MTRSSSLILLAMSVLAGCASTEVKAPCRRLPADVATAYADPCGSMQAANKRFEDVDLGELPASIGQNPSTIEK